MLVKNDIAWDVTPPPLEIVIEVLKALFQEILRLFDPEYVGRKLVRNVRKYLPVDKAEHPINSNRLRNLKSRSQI
jgi:hypothetical protein